MKRNILLVVFFLTAFFSLQNAKAANDTLPAPKTYRVGIFAPLYLDSVFSETGSFNNWKKGLQRLARDRCRSISGNFISQSPETYRYHL